MQQTSSELSQADPQANFVVRAILVGVDLGFPHFDGELEELGLLAQTAGMVPVAPSTCKR